MRREVFSFMGFYPLLLTPDSSLDNFGDHAGAHGAAAFPDGEAQALFHGNRGNEDHRHRHIVSGITISVPLASSMAPVTSVVRK